MLIKITHLMSTHTIQYKKKKKINDIGMLTSRIALTVGHSEQPASQRREMNDALLPNSCMPALSECIS